MTDIDAAAGEAAVAVLASEGLAARFARHGVCSRDQSEGAIAAARASGGGLADGCNEMLAIKGGTLLMDHGRLVA